MCSVKELDQLANILKVPVASATVNKGSGAVASGLVANDTSAVMGTESTGAELTMIEAIFSLNDTADKQQYAGIDGGLLDELE